MYTGLYCRKLNIRRAYCCSLLIRWSSKGCSLLHSWKIQVVLQPTNQVKHKNMITMRKLWTFTIAVDYSVGTEEKSCLLL